MQRSVLVGGAGLGTILAAFGIASLATAVPTHQTASPVVLATATTTQPSSPLPHLSGTDLLSAFYGKRISHLDPSVLRTLIVTIADPVSSHLDWSYDAGIESLFRALESDDYVVDRFWLPWRPNGDTAAARLGVADSFPAARWPGVLLFRKSNPLDSSIILVYVVGEVPTSGVNAGALRFALDERRRLLISDSAARWSDTLRIVGPTFSGSALSLRHAIANWRDSTKDTSFAKIVTGSASDSTNLHIFEMERVGFGATVHTSTWLETTAESLIVQRLGIRRSELAFLHEGTTQYGAALRDTSRDAKGDSTQPLRLSFPMNISSLRAEYATHPVAPPTPTRDAPPAPTPPRLALDQREPASLTESPAVLSQLTAPSVEILMSQIERSMAAHHIRAVGILATDIRDELFLADELRQQLHDVQIFFYGSNSLFLRSEYRAAVNGSLVLSTYPLVLENQYWDLTKNDNERLIFASDQSEGLFNAVLYQLGDTVAMTEYAAPIERSGAGRSVAPPAWVTVVGRNDMYPVTLAGDSARVGRATEQKYMVARPAPAQRQSTEPALPAWRFLLLLLLLVVGFSLSLVALQWRTAPRVQVIDAAPCDVLTEIEPAATKDTLTLLRAARSASLLLHRELYVLLRFFSLFVGFSGGLLILMRPRAHGLGLPTAGLVVLGAVAAFWALVILWRAVVQSFRVLSVGRGQGIALVFAKVARRRRDKMLWFVEIAARVAVLIAGVSYVLLTLFFLWQVMGLDERTSAFFFERVVSVAGGVSPAVPIVLAATGFAAWCSWHLMRITLLAEPTVFEEFLLRRDAADLLSRATKRRIRDCRRRAEQQKRSAIQLSRRAEELVEKEATHNENGRAAGNGNGNGNGNARGGWWKLAVSADYVLDQARRAQRLAQSAVEDAQRQLDEAHTGDILKRSVIDQLSEIETPDILQAAATAQQAVSEAEEKFCVRRGSSAALQVETIPAKTSNTPSGAFDAASLGLRLQPRRQFRARVGTVVRWIGSAYTQFEDWYELHPIARDPSERSSTAAQDLSDSLFYMIPSGTALIGFLIALGFGIWLASEFELSLEAFILPRLAWLGGVTTFDALFRFGTIALIGVTAWGIYRLIDIWSHVRTILRDIDPELHPSLAALPRKLARVTRLTPFGQTSRSDIEEVVDDRWNDMRRALDATPQPFCEMLTEHLEGKGLNRPPFPRSRPYELNGGGSDDFDRLHLVLGWCRDSGLLAASPTAPNDAEQVRASIDQAERNFARKVADLYAVFIADYVDWVFQHLRYLASFLLVALVLTIVLLSSYPFQPQNTLKVLYTVVLVAAVGSLLLVIVQMNRDETLSAISKTEGGTVSWDPQFVSAIATYGAIPIITLVSTEFPAVREFLFSWVTPLIRIFSKG